MVILDEGGSYMKPSDTPPTPLDHKPATNLTELRRKSAGEGFENVTYQGEDGYRYEATVKDNIIAVQWRRLPAEEI